MLPVDGTAGAGVLEGAGGALGTSCAGDGGITIEVGVWDWLASQARTRLVTMNAAASQRVVLVRRLALPRLVMKPDMPPPPSPPSPPSLFCSSTTAISAAANMMWMARRIGDRRLCITILVGCGTGRVRATT